MRSTFGWDYPAGAEHDPNAPYNQRDEDCPKCDGLGTILGDICVYCDGTGARDDELLKEVDDELNRD